MISLTKNGVETSIESFISYTFYVCFKLSNYGSYLTLLQVDVFWSIGNMLLHFSLASDLCAPDSRIHDVLKNVRQYNCLFAGGACSFILKSDDCEFLVTASALVAFICQEIASSNGGS
uniref:Uncharacterized protein n=1 Tax=Lactuca sativa TaxID=4236 RepID=A0A9R1W0U3_LACSA|nr:hypothetical protein LSAT_V11C400202800 [Lactuca sativa]